MSQHVQSHTYFISKSYQSLVCGIDSLCELDDQLDGLYSRYKHPQIFMHSKENYMWPPWCCRQSRKIARWNKSFCCTSGGSGSYCNSGYTVQAHCEHLDNKINFRLLQHERLICTDSCFKFVCNNLRLRHFVYSPWKKIDLRRNVV